MVGTRCRNPEELRKAEPSARRCWVGVDVLRGGGSVGTTVTIARGATCARAIPLKTSAKPSGDDPLASPVPDVFRQASGSLSQTASTEPAMEIRLLQSPTSPPPPKRTFQCPRGKSKERTLPPSISPESPHRGLHLARFPPRRQPIRTGLARAQPALSQKAYEGRPSPLTSRERLPPALTD